MASLLGRARQEGGLVVCAPVYAELLAHPNATPAFVGDFLSTTGVVVEFEMEEAIWREAASAFVSYVRRRRKAAQTASGQVSKRLLVDFLIGAHAIRRADRLLTLDPARYSRDFPKLTLMP